MAASSSSAGTASSLSANTQLASNATDNYRLHVKLPSGAAHDYPLKWLKKGWASTCEVNFILPNAGSVGFTVLAAGGIAVARREKEFPPLDSPVREVRMHGLNGMPKLALGATG